MPTLTHVYPSAALPGGEVMLEGAGLGPELTATVSGVPALVTLARPTRASIVVPEGTLPGELIVAQRGGHSNPLPLHVAIPMAENLHPVTSPAVDSHGNVYTTLSGSRGQQTPVSVFRIAPAPAGVTHQVQPFVREILNPTGLAVHPLGDLFVSSRAEGIVYRVTPRGDVSTFAEGLGIATGIAFDSAGDLYVGDRSGTLFKIRVELTHSGPIAADTFVFATLEPSIAAYHLAFHPDGTLFVTGPTTASSQVVYAIAPDGAAGIFFRGLGRPQGMACDVSGALYVAASYRGQRGVHRIAPGHEPVLAVAGASIIGLCLLPHGRAAVATRDAVYEVTLST